MDDNVFGRNEASSSNTNNPNVVENDPIQSQNMTDEESIYFPDTQDTNDEIDVVWDWNSPKQPERKKVRFKRFSTPVQSPKQPIKRNQAQHIQNFNKLREELLALKEELATSHDEDSFLRVSPVQEAEFKNTPHTAQVNSLYDDLFNDSINDQLVLCTQQFENNTNEIKNDDDVVVDEDGPSEVAIVNTANDNNEQFNLFDDSLDGMLSDFPQENIERLTQNVLKKETAAKVQSPKAFVRSKSEAGLPSEHKMFSPKTTFNRNKSFEIITSQSHVLSKEQLDEIEKNRREALERLRKRKLQNTCDEVKVKCSPEEIEKKRLHALAKLEARKQQNVIEMKRLEAVRKLQLNRNKNS